MSKQLKAACSSLVTLVLIGVWVDITGYLDVFSNPAATNLTSETTRYACYVGRIAMALAFLLAPRFFSGTFERRAPITLGLMFTGTLLYSFGFHQSLFNPLIVSASGSMLIGMGHIWITALAYEYVEHIGSGRLALWVIVAGQLFERLVVELLRFAMGEDALILWSYLLPAAAVGSLFFASRMFVRFRPLVAATDVPGRGTAAQRYFVVLCVMAGVGIVTCGAMSKVGIWGNAGTGQFTGEAQSLAMAAMQCLLMVTCCRVTFLSKDRKPLALRYQSSLLVLITGFALTSSRQMLFLLPPNLVDTLLVVVENYAHALFWVITLDAARSLSQPVYRTFGVSLLACSATGLLWSVFLEHRLAAAESTVFIVFYLIVIVCIVYPQALNRTNARSSSSEEDINAFVLEGEQRLTSGINGRALQDALEQRCSVLAQEYGLSSRETDVLIPLVKGATRQAMCKELHLSEGTIKTHLTHIYGKLGIHSQADLLAIVYSTGENPREQKPTS